MVWVFFYNGTCLCQLYNYLLRISIGIKVQKRGDGRRLHHNLFGRQMSKGQCLDIGNAAAAGAYVEFLHVFLHLVVYHMLHDV